MKFVFPEKELLLQKDIDILPFSVKQLNKLRGQKISTIEELIRLTPNEIKSILNEKNKTNNFQVLFNSLHNLGLTFRDEYSKFGISSEEATEKLSKSFYEINEDSFILKTPLSTVGEILTLDLNQLQNLNNYNELELLKFKYSLDILGYVTLDDYKKVEERLREYKLQGKVTLEDLGFSRMTSLIFYKNGIYTSNDLFSYDGNIFEICKFSPKIQRNIMSTLDFLNIIYDESIGIIKDPLLVSSNAENIQKKKLLYQKRILASKYKELLEENRTLGEESQNVDTELKTIYDELTEYFGNIKKKHIR